MHDRCPVLAEHFPAIFACAPIKLLPVCHPGNRGFSFGICASYLPSLIRGILQLLSIPELPLCGICVWISGEPLKPLAAHIYAISRACILSLQCDEQTSQVAPMTGPVTEVETEAFLHASA